MKEKQLIVITGPTAVGKTEVVLTLAERAQLEIISCDSRQFYREMTIGTAKPSPAELNRAPHHFINSLSIHDEYSAGDYESDALNVLGQCFQRKSPVILSGGSGLYIKALCEGLNEFPSVPAALLEEISNYPLEKLQKEVGASDPNYYSNVDVSNKRRLVRALSVIKVSGKPFSSFHQQEVKTRDFKVRYIVLERDRKELYERINDRVDLMMEAGLLDEVKELVKYKHLKALQTVGYQELFDYLEGKCSLEEAIELIKRNTRRYAKRQLTWFRKLNNAEWMHPSELLETLNIENLSTL